MAFYKVCGRLFLLLTIFITVDMYYHALAYDKLSIENDQTCSTLFRPRDFTLGENNRSGLIIQESNFLESNFFNRLSSDHKLECHFKVAASFNFGVFAVIQSMNLRRDIKTGDCLDYVQFRHSKKNPLSDILNVNVGLEFKKHKIDWGPKYCGSMSAFEAGNLEHSLYSGLSLNGFMEEEGRMEVLIVISKKEKSPKGNLSLEIAFTSYKVCSRNIGAYRQCGPNSCIWKNYFRDGVVNCPFINCVDEGGCDDSDMLFTSLGTKVTITAVSSIFISFFLFLFCIWMCRYFEFLCWGINEIRHRNNPVEMDPMHTSTPTVLPQQHTPLDKDLPPSYETLFPDRKNSVLRS